MRDDIDRTIIGPGGDRDAARTSARRLEPEHDPGSVRSPQSAARSRSRQAAPRYRDRIGAYASIRRSRRKGQFRRIISITFGSHSATSTAGSVPASARMRRLLGGHYRAHIRMLHVLPLIGVLLGGDKLCQGMSPGH